MKLNTRLRLAALLAALAAAVSLTACSTNTGESGGRPASSQENLFSESSEAASPSSGETVSTGTASSDSGALNSSQAQAAKDVMNVKGKTCTILANAQDKYLIEEFKNQCGGTLKYVIEDYSNMKLKLAQMQLADQAPDIYCVGNQDYPTMLFRDQLQALDSLIDFNSDTWKGAKAQMDRYRYNGKYYIMGNPSRASRVIWWNTSIFNEMGCKDTPDTLMAKGQWDWDAMLRLAEQTTNAKTGVYGFGYMYSLSWAYQASAGINLLSLTADGVVNNVNDPLVAKAMEAFTKICDKKIAYQGGGNPQQEFANGKIAMYFDLAELGSADNLKKLVSADTIKMAHFPKMPGAKGYRYSGEFSGYAVPTGAKNLDCAVAFLTMHRVQTSYQQQVRERYYKDYNFTANSRKIYEEANGCEFVDNIALGINEVLEAYRPSEYEAQLGAPWSTVKNKLYPKVQAALDGLGV